MQDIHCQFRFQIYCGRPVPGPASFGTPAEVKGQRELPLPHDNHVTSDPDALWLSERGSCGILHFSHSFNKQSLNVTAPAWTKKMPLVGNLFDMPATDHWEIYQKWSRDFDSDIIHLNVVGKSIIVLSSLQATKDLMVHGILIAPALSNLLLRARLPMVNELMGWDFSFGVLSAKYSNTVFSVTASQQFQPMKLASTHALLRRILKNPEGCMMEHFEQMTGELIMSITYGNDVLDANDPYLKLAHQSMHDLAAACVPGKYLVDAIPVLKYIPTWFPGAGFKRDARKWSQATQQYVELPFEEAKRKIAAGVSRASFISQVLSMKWDSMDPHYSTDAIRDTAGTILSGGSHSTVSVLGTFALAMLLHPEIQKKAQSEIDSVVGHDRLPSFKDKPTLPYIEALVKELFRWEPVAPLGGPHFVAVENEYRGYRIPAGSIILGNTWAIFHDEALYPEPFEFRPERFLSAAQPDRINPDPVMGFGYGRRACPGQYVALDSVWIAVASILAVFHLTKAVEDDGKVIEPRCEYFSGLARIPLPFKASVRPRSKRCAEIVEATAM
ncbi:cytochrome P450 [Mycena albidolilacea]|uniref:Cytochrome P450 n=1 Tax=Mycena albidolilacea TaxID=1033008 RepID=A0AAD7ENP4_9AGAR|nr:cytochrome P450 [Mycena albidolilacea]